MMTERKKCSQRHLAVQLQWDKVSTLLVLQAVDVGCRHVNEIRIELGNATAFQSKCDGSVFQWACGTPQTMTRAVNKRALSAAFSSAGVRATTAGAVPVVPLIVSFRTQLRQM